MIRSSSSRAVFGLLGLVVLAWLLGGYEVPDAGAWPRAGRSLLAFLRALGHPDLSGTYLVRALGLLLVSLAIAVLGLSLAVLGGFALGLLTSANVVVADATGGRRRWRALGAAAARLLQDVLRGIPDFAWAVVAIPFLGLGPVAGVAALALSNAGILGRLYSEAFDAIPPGLLEPIRSAGAGRLQAFFYGVLPRAAAPALSVTLLRWECAARNAAVIGVVGGGGLGSEISLRLSYGQYDKLLTLLLLMLVLTVGSERLSDAVRGRFRSAGARTGQRVAALLAAWGLLAAVSAVALGVDVRGLLSAERWESARRLFGGLLRPDLSPPLVAKALGSAVIPLSMAFLGTALGTLLAVLLSYPAASPPDSGYRDGWLLRSAAPVRRLLARGAAVVARGVPDVLWAMLLVSVTGLGSLPGMLALAVHSFGLLLRLFRESVEAVPLPTLEVVEGATGSRVRTFLYAAVPTALPDWAANAFLQLESNVRAAVVLGMVGAPGLGFLFSFEFEFFRFERAATYLLVMVALAVALDRLSRRLGLALTRTPQAD